MEFLDEKLKKRYESAFTGFCQNRKNPPSEPIRCLENVTRWMLITEEGRELNGEISFLHIQSFFQKPEIQAEIQDIKRRREARDTKKKPLFFKLLNKII